MYFEKTYKNGDFFRGLFFNNQPHGDGILEESGTKNTYNGDWKFGKRHGYGT